MEELENLRSIAEISIALTGFTGIVATFGKRQKGKWSPLELLRLRMLLETSLVVLIVALIALLLFSLSLPELTVWKWSNGIQATIHTLGIILLTARIKKLKPEDWPKEETVFTLILLPISLTIIGFQLAAASGYLPSKGFFLFFSGAVYLLLLSVLHFVLLLIPEESESKS